MLEKSSTREFSMQNMFQTCSLFIHHCKWNCSQIFNSSGIGVIKVDSLQWIKSVKWGCSKFSGMIILPCGGPRKFPQGSPRHPGKGSWRGRDMADVLLLLLPFPEHLSPHHLIEASSLPSLCCWLVSYPGTLPSCSGEAVSGPLYPARGTLLACLPEPLTSLGSALTGETCWIYTSRWLGCPIFSLVLILAHKQWMWSGHLHRLSISTPGSCVIGTRRALAPAGTCCLCHCSSA